MLKRLFTRPNPLVMCTLEGHEDVVSDCATGAEGATVRDVRVFLIGFGEDAEMTSLQRIAEATDAAAYDATDPRSIDKVFESVVSNF